MYCLRKGRKRERKGDECSVWLVNQYCREKAGIPETEYIQVENCSMRDVRNCRWGCSISRIHVGNEFQTDRQWNNIC